MPRLELDGQSSQHRHESKVRGHQACCVPWANPQSTKGRDPLKGQTLPPACASGREGRRKQLCYWLHSPPPLTSHHTWQPSVLKDHSGNWEHSLEEQWMTEHRWFISQIYRCILVCILLNLGQSPGDCFAWGGCNKVIWRSRDPNLASSNW